MDFDRQKNSPHSKSVEGMWLARSADRPRRGKRILVARSPTGVAFEVAVDRGLIFSPLCTHRPATPCTKRLVKSPPLTLARFAMCAWTPSATNE